MAEDNVAASLFQSPEEFDSLLQILKQSIDDHDSSPIDSTDTIHQLSVSPPSSESSTCGEEIEENYTNDQIAEIQTCLEQNIKEPQVELSQYNLSATFGPRRKPEMTFMLSISDATTTLPFNEKCSIEINGDEINTNYDYFNRKPRSPSNKIWKTGYCVHARLYLRDEKDCVYLMKNDNPHPLSFVYSKDRFSAFKDGQLKLRLRENLTMKHLPVTDEKHPPQLLIQFSLTYQGEKLLETEQLPISFTSTKKKRYAETTDIFFSPNKIPSSAPLLEPSTKRVKSEPSLQSSIPQNQFPTASAIWSSTSPVDIINYLEAQMMSQSSHPPPQYNTIVPTVYMLVPAKPTSAQGITPNPVIMSPYPNPIPMMYNAVPPSKSPQKSPRKPAHKEMHATEFYSNIQINGALSIPQPLGEILPTMVPKQHVPMDPHQMECWLDSLSS